MNNNVEVREARERLQQATDRTMLEHIAWEALQKSKKVLISSYLNSGLTAANAEIEFCKHMKDHSDRYAAALDNQSKASTEYAAMLRQ